MFRFFGRRPLRALTRADLGAPLTLIPTTPVLTTLLLGAVLRSTSYLDLAQQTRRRRWRHLCRLPGALSDDTLAYVTERLELADLRHALARVATTLKHNKALESCRINGLLCLSLDANEHFHSRSRCCAQCGQRQVEVDDEHGHVQPVTEYHHRYVVAQLNGPKINVVLDLETIRPGKAECGAALRLLGRLRRVYGPRFFDALTVDAGYAIVLEAPILALVDFSTEFCAPFRERKSNLVDGSKADRTCPLLLAGRARLG